MIEKIYRDYENKFLIEYDKIKWDLVKFSPDQRISLLIVEDESSFREMLKEIFSNQEVYNIDTASNGEEGLNRFVKNSYDLVLTDVMMNVLTGIEMAEKMIKLKPEQKIFFVSSWSSKKQVFDKFEKEFTKGCFQFIDKPFDLDDFQNRVYLLLNDNLSGVVFHVLDRSALNNAISNLEPYQILVLHKEILSRCIFLAKQLINKLYTRESISALFLKNSDYMKIVGCTFDETYCRGNVCIKLAPKCMVQKLKKQIEIIVDLIEEIYDYYKRFELRKKI